MVNKWISRLLAVCAIATVAELTIPQVGYAQPDASDPRVLSVSALGRSMVPADRALLVVQYQTNYYNDPDPETGISLQPTISFSDVKPVVDALVAAGVPAEAISDSRDPYTNNLRLVVAVGSPTSAKLRELRDLATKTEIDGGKFTAGTSLVLYTVAECDRAEAAAYEDAISGLEERAAMMADKAGVELGQLLQMSTYSAAWGDGYSTSSQRCPRTIEDVISMVPYGGQGYDLALPAQVMVDVSLSATYEIE